MKLCLNMIVRNEADRIERALASVLPHISCAVIVDTGSTDDTAARIARTVQAAGIDSYVVLDAPFENFSQARNVALDAAKNQVEQDFDYLLLLDADMELVVDDPACFDNLTGASYDMLQKGGGLTYGNRRLLKRGVLGRYVGATHEYLDVPAAGLIKGAHFIDHADGANRKDKFTRDIALLIADLRKDPNNPRSWYYLAQSYRDNGQFKRAAKAYLRRSEMGDYAEEAWSALANYGHCLKALGDDAGFIKAQLDAYAMRPSRAEPLYDLAKFYREQPAAQAISTMLSATGLRVPYPADLLFVNDFVYQAGLREEFSITAWYDPATRPQGFKVTNALSLDPSVPVHVRDGARGRLYHYLRPITDYLRSFVATSIPNPDPDYVALNPSVAQIDGRLHAVVRTVNYRIDDAGRYLIKNSEDGSITNDNPIHTKNYFVRLNDDLTIHSAALIETPLSPPAFALVRGYEDMRLFVHCGATYVSATMRELLPSGQPVQVLAMLDHRGTTKSPTTTAPIAMSDGSSCEKNWMPFPFRKDKQFVYRLGRFVDMAGQPAHEDTPAIAVDALNGGTQLVPFAQGYLALVHEAGFIPGTSRRYYQHRFVWWNADLKVEHLSLPFYFNDRVIEFAAGLCWHPDGKRLVVSYGFKDEEARLATIDADELRTLVFNADV